MGVIVKFPDGRTEEKNYVTMYHENNGTDYIVIETDKKENENRIVGVSFKPQGETYYSSPVNTDTNKAWDATKKVLVDDIHDRKDDFTYSLPTGEILVTESYTHELALRDANYQKLIDNYQSFLKESKKEQETSTINPFEQPVAQETPVITSEEPTNVALPNATEISPVETPELVTEQPTPEVIQNTPNVMETPIIETPVAAQTDAQEVNIPVAPQPVEEPVTVQEETPKEESTSIVSKSYLETVNELITQVKLATDKYIEYMEETKNEIGRQLEEARKINDLAKQTYDSTQQIMAAQANAEVTRDLTKAA